MKKNKRHIVSIVSAVLLLAIAGLVYINRYLCLDFIKSLSYHPTQEVEEVENKLNLTDRAKMIFAATDPSLDDKNTFNSYCDSTSINTSVLGCYTGEHIHVYNIDYQELDGIVESTTAHELLHAVWERLSDSEKRNLESDLLNVYNNNQNINDEISDNYDEADKLNELFARAGTEVKNLPDSLEKVYSRYFTDQDSIVDYYNKYSSTFKKINQRIEELDAEIKTRGEILDDEISEYDQRNASLAAEVDTFNDCAQTINCFSSLDAFYTRRAELLAEQEEVTNLYNELSQAIQDYNDLINEYNETALKGNQLNNIVDSKAPSGL